MKKDINFKDIINEYLNYDLAIELGSSKISIYDNHRGLVLSQPSYIATYTQKNGYNVIKAIGDEAKKLYDKEPEGFSVSKPIKKGKIHDDEKTEKLLSIYLKQIQPYRLMSAPKVIVSIPEHLSEVETRVIEEVITNSGAKKVILTPEPICYGIGSGLPIENKEGHLVVDMGAGKVSISVLSYNSIVKNKTIFYAGNYIDDQISDLLLTQHHLHIGKGTAEKIKKNIGTAYFDPEKHDSYPISVPGINITKRQPEKVEILKSDIYLAIMSAFEEIIIATRKVIQETPPELADNLINNGITITGGLSKIDGIKELFEEEFNIPVNICGNGDLSNIYGLGKLLKYLKEKRGF